SIQPGGRLLVPGVLQGGWGWQTDGTAAIDLRVVAVGHQDRQRWAGVADRVREQVGLPGQTWGGAVGDLLAQRQDGLTDRGHEDRRFAAVLLVERLHLLVDPLEVPVVLLLELFPVVDTAIRRRH